MRASLFICVVLFLVQVCRADERPPIDPSGIRGSLVIAGGSELPESIVDRFVELAGGRAARLVLIPTAATDEAAQDTDRHRVEWRKYELPDVTVLHTRSRSEADREEFVGPLAKATAVWFGGGQQSRLAEAYVGTRVETELHALLNRGGVIGGTSAGAAIQSRLMIAGGNPIAQTSTGFDLLPGAVIDQHFLQRDRKPRLLRVLSEHPGHIGFGVDERTALVVRQRRIEVIGDERVTISLAASANRPNKEMALKSGGVADLTALRRAARARTESPFPPAMPQPPRLAEGALVIGGGGRMPPEVMKQFVELAGGPDALIVALPTAGEVNQPTGDGEKRLLQSAGAKNIVVLPARELAEVDSAATLEVLRRASGIWFGGGRQWRFVDAYEGTQAATAFHDVLRRGGVIGGSSAGASIQAEYMVRGSPLGNQEMMAEGYERGLGFLPGTAVDQHFTQRRRHDDLASVVAAHPQLLGIGIDEETALVVHGSTAEVRGNHRVYFLHQPRDAALEKTEVRSGQKFNLVTRTLLD